MLNKWPSNSASYNVITDKSTCRPVKEMGWWTENHEVVKEKIFFSWNRSFTQKIKTWKVWRKRQYVRVWCEMQETFRFKGTSLALVFRFKKTTKIWTSLKASGSRLPWKLMCLGKSGIENAAWFRPSWAKGKSNDCINPNFAWNG